MEQSNTQLPTTKSQFLTPLAMFLAGSLAFIAIAADVHFQGQLARADQPIAAFIHNHAQGWATFLLSGISGLGGLKVIVAGAGAVGALLIYRRRWRSLAVWAVGLSGSGIINASLKHAFAIPRPDRYTFYDFGPDSGYTFPSGHTMAVTITAGLLALLYLRQKPLAASRRWVIGALAALIGILEAGALMYVGVHYLTDVLAALAISLAWLGILRLFLPPARLTDSTS